MNLTKNGFVVAEFDTDSGLYKSWPLSSLYQDKDAMSLTDEIDEELFSKYDMQHIVIDEGYIKRYLEYCEKISLNICVLLFETPLAAPSIGVDVDVEIIETLGFDCIGTVYYSYLQEELTLFASELAEKNTKPNKNGLFDELSDVQTFISLRRHAISEGLNLEDYWKEIPAKISIVKVS